jgi:Ca2+-binding EF-hand superfamily protein
VPYLINDNLSPELLKTLLEIFDKFDKDKDRALNPKELDRFVYYTNEQHPSHALLIQIAQQFGANEKGWLTLEGFLVSTFSFFLFFSLFFFFLIQLY